MAVGEMTDNNRFVSSIKLGRGKITLGAPLNEQGLSQLQQWGVTHVATLQTSEETPTKAQLMTANLGAAWLWLPLSKVLPASESEQAHVQQYLVELKHTLMEGGRIYLHCDTSTRRACLMLLAICRLYGMSAGAAYRALHSISATGANNLPRNLLGWADRLGQSITVV